MKKNAMLKIAAILMVAVLLTTCAISSTFAKYVTKGGADTSARVAKWGVEINTNIFANAEGKSSANDLFFQEYGTGTANAASTHVKSDALVVAPGTSGSMTLDNAVSGTPEVSGEVIVEADIALEGKWEKKAGGFYCPLVFTINGVEVKGYEFTSLDEIKAEFGSALKETLQFDAGQSITDAVDFVISWKWDFAEVESTDKTNENDTFLGDLIADDDSTNDPEITISFSITVQQTGEAGTGVTETVLG
jgi:hypothetical protein